MRSALQYSTRTLIILMWRTNMRKNQIKSLVLTLSLFFSFALPVISAVREANAQAVIGVDMKQRKYVLTAATGNNFTAGSIGYINSSGQAVLASALNSSTASGLLVMATETVNAGASGSFRILEGDFTTSGLTPGVTYYLSETSGAITATPPAGDGSIRRVIGEAISSTKLYLKPNNVAISVNSATGGGGGGGSTPTSPAVEAFSSTFGSTGTLTTVAPADIVSGEGLFLFSATDLLAAATNTFTPPAGFNSLIPYTRANAAGDGIGFQAWYKIASGESGDYVVTETAARLSTTAMLRVSGLEPSSVTIDVATCATGTAEPVTTPVIAATTDDTMILTVYSWDQGKTLVAAPSGVTQAVHNDQNGNDLWVGYEIQAISGNTTARTIDISANAPWVACTISLKELNATSTGSGGGGGGGGAGPGEGDGPFPLLDDGTGSPIKLTLPIACNGSFVGSACEIFPNNDFHWEAGDPDLATYEHPIYFIRDPEFYTFCSPNTGATTGNANNGRSELRYLANVSTGHLSRQYVFRVPSGAMANSAQANIGQIHRNPGSPIFKGTYTHKTDGTGIYRILYKNVDGQNGDTAWNMGLGDKILLNSIAPGDYIRVKYDYDIGAETLAFWASNDEGTKVETELGGSPLVTFTGIVLDNPSAYSKLGMYMNNAGDGLNTDAMCVQVYQDLHTGP